MNKIRKALLDTSNWSPRRVCGVIGINLKGTFDVDDIEAEWVDEGPLSMVIQENYVIINLTNLVDLRVITPEIEALIEMLPDRFWGEIKAQGLKACELQKQYRCWSNEAGKFLVQNGFFKKEPKNGSYVEGKSIYFYTDQYTKEQKKLLRLFPYLKDFQHRGVTITLKEEIWELKVVAPKSLQDMHKLLISL